MIDRLPRAFYARSPDLAARDLIGCVISVPGEEPVTARIVETEAYGDKSDLASHAAIYHRSRSEIMAAEPGSVYVYRSYGIHLCLNIVAHEPGSSGAVLIRAIEPIAGIDVMALRRGVEDLAIIGRGPGNVAAALGVNLDHLGADVVAGNAIGIAGGMPVPRIGSSPRVGISRSIDREWRYFDPESAAVSKSRSRRLVG